MIPLISKYNRVIFVCKAVLFLCLKIKKNIDLTSYGLLDSILLLPKVCVARAAAVPPAAPGDTRTEPGFAICLPYSAFIYIFLLF